MNILAFCAHPDDIELNVGGTLLKYKKQGHKIFIASCWADQDVIFTHDPADESAYDFNPLALAICRIGGLLPT